MQWSASDRARGVMIRPAVHRRPGLFGTSIGTSFDGFLGIVPAHATAVPANTDWPGSSRAYGRSVARCCGSTALLR